MGLEIWYESPYLKAIYQYGETGINGSQAEVRIHLLYQLLEKRIMPWMWDHENYMDENKDMYGYFYPEDLGCILQIAYLQGQRKDRK